MNGKCRNTNTSCLWFEFILPYERQVSLYWHILSLILIHIALWTETAAIQTHFVFGSNSYCLMKGDCRDPNISWLLFEIRVHHKRRMSWCVHILYLIWFQFAFWTGAVAIQAHFVFGPNSYCLMNEDYRNTNTFCILFEFILSYDRELTQYQHIWSLVRIHIASWSGPIGIQTHFVFGSNSYCLMTGNYRNTNT